MAPNLNHEDFDRLAKALDDGLRPYVNDLVQHYVVRIPRMIREEIDELIRGGLHAELRDIVHESITVIVEVKAKE